MCKRERKIDKMTNYEVIREICKENNGIVTAPMVAEKEVPSWYLSDMVKKGELVRVARGIYGTNEGDYDDYYFFQRRNGRCIFSYASALHLHGLTDRVPFQKEVTVYKGYNSSHITDNTTIELLRTIYIHYIMCIQCIICIMCILYLVCLVCI